MKNGRRTEEGASYIADEGEAGGGSQTIIVVGMEEVKEEVKDEVKDEVKEEG